ncbi:uncharacterized protein HD556DRAFT_61722 [Suillus plorans]|uniref:Uncharacterized protein n=1 Tax=Suillus plorans TaxID=116603 RepID=A0A9P7J2M7_9AGAM|nr:uncharacterized protein HD556DRAFT_61722 [Suillus plorans]KAG1799735.1 hypothetical protein HD556DRAFT_61722 [Suillus plorans]
MSLPALDRMFITSVWLQCIIYGVNCVLFGVCMYAIFIRNKRAHWIVPFSCIFHFSMATAHIIISFLYALHGLTDPAVISVPNGSTLYFASVTALWSTMTGLYLFNVLVLHFLLIWRFYLVWNRNLILAIILLILEVGHLSTALAAWSVVTHSRVTFASAAWALATADFIFNLVLTICLTSGIAYRLWRAGADTFDLTGHNAYKPAIYTIIQCGAIYTSSIVVICVLRLSGKPAGLVAPYVGIQFATLTPLLLIVSLKFGVRHDEA